MQRVYNLKKSLQPLVSAQTLKKLVTMADSHAVQVSVDITSDIVCPWCWVGKRHLDVATDRLRGQVQLNIRWLPFCLNPFVPEEGMSFQDYAAIKFGSDSTSLVERLRSGKLPFAEAGKAVGLQFNYSTDRKIAPTRKAHILLSYAFSHGKQHALQERLFEANFQDSKDISDDSVLRQLVEETGLDADEAMAALSDAQHLREYEEEVATARKKGINGVPFFEMYLTDQPGLRQQFSGAQPIDTFVSVLKRTCVRAKV